MRRRAATCGIVFVLLSGCLDPRADNSYSDFNFKLARQGERISHTFELKNSTDVLMRVNKVSYTCGCTVADVAPGTTIMSGEALKVPVTLDVSGKSGPMSSSIALWVQGQAEPHEFTMRGEVFQEYPSKVSFDSFRRGERVSRSFILRPFPGQPSVEILDFHVNKSYATVNWALTTESAGSLEVVLSSIDDVPYGYFDIPVVFVTNDSKVPQKSLGLTGYVLSPLESTKTEIVFGDLKQNETFAEEFELWSPYGDALDIVQVKNSREGLFEWELITGPDPNRVTIRVTTSNSIPAEPFGLVKGELVFFVTVGGTEQKARVEVYGFV